MNLQSRASNGFFDLTLGVVAAPFAAKYFSPVIDRYLGAEMKGIEVSGCGVMLKQAHHYHCTPIEWRRRAARPVLQYEL